MFQQLCCEFGLQDLENPFTSGDFNTLADRVGLLGYNKILAPEVIICKKLKVPFTPPCNNFFFSVKMFQQLCCEFGLQDLENPFTRGDFNTLADRVGLLADRVENYQ